MKIIVATNKRKGLIFEFFKPENYDDEYGVCFNYCPYSKMCQILPDPRRKNKKLNFIDFCAEQAKDYIPIAGSLEKYYGKLIEKIKLKK